MHVIMFLPFKIAYMLIILLLISTYYKSEIFYSNKSEIKISKNSLGDKCKISTYYNS
jgi:hypothetical protein